jgi:dimethylargininase
MKEAQSSLAKPRVYNRRVLRTAIVRPPCSTFANGLTSGQFGAPNADRARAQHQAYVAALESCGLRVIALAEDPAHPDSTFVEDTAVVIPGGVVLARPGAPSRRGEVEPMRQALAPLVSRLETIQAPGMLDGGDVCAIGPHYLIGLSERTNDEGAHQLEAFLAAEGCSFERIALARGVGLLHLKSGLSWLGDRRVMAVGALLDHPALEGFERIRVDPEESLGANGVVIGDQVLIPSDCPRLERRLGVIGLSAIALEMSEFQKMDGGVSCLSLRWLEGLGSAQRGA